MNNPQGGAGREERAQLLAEKGTLQRMLLNTPESHAIDRASLKARLATVERRLASIVEDDRLPARARLTFRGKPVVGSRGVFAEFGMDVTRRFSEAVAMVAAANARPLAAAGPIPRESGRLLITGTAVGSFGFELEEHRDDALLLDEESSIALALEMTQDLLRATTEGDDELTEAAAKIDPRAINTLRGFLETLANNEAVCSLRFGEHVFSFRDVAQVAFGAKRLEAENRHEKEVTFQGAFVGALPQRRTFEFKPAGEDRLISGRIGPEASPEAINTHLHKTTSVRLTETRIGNGRPRYLLRQTPKWPGDGAAV